jgi:hypothetical protein
VKKVEAMRKGWGYLNEARYIPLAIDVLVPGTL